MLVVKVIKYLKSDEVDVIVLTANCRRCDHTMRIIQRVLESSGLVTISITNISNGKDSIVVPRSLYVEPASKITGNANNNDDSKIKVIMGEVLKHLAVTDKPGLQSYIGKYLKHDVETAKDESQKKNQHGLNDTVFEPFDHRQNQSEDFAWTAYVKYY